MIKLLDEMKKIPLEKRQAYFYCAIVLFRYPDDPAPIIATGQLEGQINDHISGDQGFGYDPIFFLNHYQKTLGELPFGVKNTLSHRGRAMMGLKLQLNLKDE